MIARRRGLGPTALAVALAACSVVEGTDVATTFGDGSASNPSGTPPTTSEGDTEASGDSSGSADGNGSADSGDTSTPPATGSDGGSSGAPPADEQPEDGMYSACAGVGECIGLTTCVLVGATGFCSDGCADPVQDCVPNPSASSTAPPLCVDNGAGMMVCALSCSMGQPCPGGMDCMPLGATMVCA
jgi:hypothetical protein